MKDMSKIDLELVRCLLENPRASFADMARTTGVSETTVKRHVDSLIESGVIKPAMIPNVRLLGFETMAVLGIKIDLDRVAEVARIISEMPTITSAHMTLGRYDVIATIAVRDLDGLTRAITKQFAAIEGIREVETFVSTRALKILHNWRLPENDVEESNPSKDTTDMT